MRRLKLSYWLNDIRLRRSFICIDLSFCFDSPHSLDFEFRKMGKHLLLLRYNFILPKNENSPI